MPLDLIRKLETLGLTAAQIVGVLEIFKEARQRTARQERNARYYQRLKASESRLKASETSESKTPSHVTSRDVTLQPDPELQPNVSQRLQTLAQQAFDAFWSLYPNKTGKGAGRKAWDKAVTRAEVDVIMAGLQRYVNKRDDRNWCNPATWLNQDRWEDQTVRGGKKDNGDILGEWLDENFSNQGNDNGQEDSGRHHGNVERLSAEQREGFKGRTIDLPPATRNGRH